MLIAFIIWGLLGSPRVPYKAVGGWAGYNFSLKNLWFNLATQAISVLMLVVYPVIIGIHYFSASSQGDLSLFTLKCTLILILGSYFLMLPIIMSILGANFIDEDSRSRYLISQFSNLIPYSLFISLLFWIFNWGSSGKVIALQSLSISFNPLLFTVLIVFFLAFFLLPYFIGIQRAKQLKNDYFDFKNSVLDDLIESIDLATPKNIIPRLEHTQRLIQQKYAELKDGDAIIDAGLRYDDPDIAGKLPQQEVFIYNCYKSARPFDKRFVYFDFLDKVYIKINELKEELTTETNAATNKETLETYSVYFKDRKKELHDINEKSAGSNPVLWIGITALASPFISQLMTEVGKYLLEYFKKG